MALPLVFQVVFVAAAFFSVMDNLQKLQEENHARTVLGSLNNIRRFTEEGVSDLANFKHYRKNKSRQDAYIQHFEELLGRIPVELKKLKRVVRSNPEELKMAERIETVGLDTRKLLAECKDNFLADNQFIAYADLPRLFKVGEEVKINLDKLAERYQDFDARIPKAQKERVLRLLLVLAAGICINIIITVVLARYFLVSIVNRISVLTENSKRLALKQDLSPLIGGSDEIANLDLAFRQMSADLKKAEQEQALLTQAALASEERTRSVIENMPVGIIIIGEENLIEALNPAAEQLFACSSRDAKNKPLTELLPENPAQKSHKSTNEVKLGLLKAELASADSKGRRSNGVIFPAEVAVSKFSTDEGKRFLVVVQDVSQRHEMERLKREFVSMVSHDLRTPLSAVQGTLDLLQDDTYGELSPQGHKRVQVASESVDRLINLINDLLDIEKMEAGKMRLELKSVSFSKILEHSLESIAPYAEKSGVRIQADLAEDYLLSADADRIIQVLINLLSNAVKFSEPGSLVIVSAALSGRMLEVSVSDQGRGIPQDALASLFQRFNQVKAADGARKKGSGLGLAICKAIVESHGGGIRVASQEGKGSCFSFSLPLAAG